MSDASTDAGWRPDPFGRSTERWWDGETWTAYARDGAEVTWDDGPVAERPDREPGLPGLWAAVVGCIVGIGLSWVVSRVWYPADGQEAIALGVSELALWSGLVGACVFVARRRGTGSLVGDFAFRFRPVDLGFGLAGSLVGRLAAGLAISPIPFPTERLDDVDPPGLIDAPGGAWAWVIVVLVVCVGAPLVEELFFRGLLQTRLVGRLGAVAGVGLASLLFGAAHLIAWDSPWTLANGWAIAAAGLVLGLLRHHTGRLGPGIVAHALFNAEAMVLVALLN